MRMRQGCVAVNSGKERRKSGMETIRIGFVGLGGICRQRHVPGFSQIEGVQFSAVGNRTEASSAAAAREFNIPTVCGTWRELVKRDDVDAVVIGTWPYLHRPVSVAALAAGKHVFCQARMAMNHDEAVEMCAAARDSGKVAALCPAPFGLSVDKTIARLLREGTLGKVHLVRVQGLSGANVDPNAPLHWRKDHRLSGLNMLTLGMFIEVIHRWFGMTRTVTAQTQIYTTERMCASGKVIDVQIPDQLLFNADMDDGLVAQYVISGMTPCGRDAIEIHGTKASLYYDVTEDVLYQAAADGARAPMPILPEDAYDVKNWSVERDFIAAIREGRPYHPDFEDGRRYMQVIQAVYDSAKFRRTIEISD